MIFFWLKWGKLLGICAFGREIQVSGPWPGACFSAGGSASALLWSLLPFRDLTQESQSPDSTCRRDSHPQMLWSRLNVGMWSFCWQHGGVSPGFLPQLEEVLGLGALAWWVSGQGTVHVALLVWSPRSLRILASQPHGPWATGKKASSWTQQLPSDLADGDHLWIVLETIGRGLSMTLRLSLVS